MLYWVNILIKEWSNGQDNDFSYWTWAGQYTCAMLTIMVIVNQIVTVGHPNDLVITLSKE